MKFFKHFLRPSFTGGIIAGAVVCVFSVAPFQSAMAQSLKSELGLLIKTNPRIEEQRAILRRAQEAVTTARAGYYPSVSLSGSVGGETTSNITRRNLGVQTDMLKFNALGFEVRQNLYDGAFTGNSVDSALMARDSVALALESTVQAVMLQGVTAYISVLRLNELIRVARARERTIREQLNLETERVERGAGIEVDVLQAKSRLQLAIEARVDLEGQLETAAADYIQAFERQPDITRMRLITTPLDVVPASLDDALYTAREQNPLIVAREFLSRSARFTVEATRSGFMPTLDLVGRWDHEYNVGAVDDSVKKAAVLIEMSWDIFSGFATRSAVASANESLLETLAGADRTKLEVERQVRVSWTKLENTRKRKELLLNAVSIAQEVFVARQKLRQAGKETTLNVLDAENEVFQAEQNLIRADYDARVAVYELASAMGIMSPVMLEIDAKVIEDIDSYFTGPDEVVDLEPVEEVEAYRAKLNSIRNPEAAAPPSEVTPPAEVAPPAAPADAPAADQPADANSVIEPPPQSQASPNPDTATPDTATPNTAPPDVAITADTVAPARPADALEHATSVKRAEQFDTTQALATVLKNASPPVEKEFGVAEQEHLVDGLPPANDPFTSAVPAEPQPETSAVARVPDVPEVPDAPEPIRVEQPVVEKQPVITEQTAATPTNDELAVAETEATTDDDDTSLVNSVRQLLGLNAEPPVENVATEAAVENNSVEDTPTQKAPETEAVASQTVATAVEVDPVVKVDPAVNVDPGEAIVEAELDSRRDRPAEKLAAVPDDSADIDPVMAEVEKVSLPMSDNPPIEKPKQIAAVQDMADTPVQDPVEEPLVDGNSKAAVTPSPAVVEAVQETAVLPAVVGAPVIVAATPPTTVPAVVPIASASQVPVTAMQLPRVESHSSDGSDDDEDSIVVWGDSESTSFEIPGSLLFGGAVPAPR